MTVNSKLAVVGVDKAQTVAGLMKRLGVALATGVVVQMYKFRPRPKRSNREKKRKHTPRTWQSFCMGALRFPLFVFTANMGTRLLNMGSRERDGLATAGFFAALGAGFVAPCISTDIALYAWLRAAYSYHKLKDWTVTPYHVFGVIYPIIAWQATYQARYLHPQQRSLYFDIGKYNMRQIQEMYDPDSPPEDGSLPKCENCPHYHPDMTCNESLRSEYIYRLPRFFSVYLKYYGAMTLFGIAASASKREAWKRAPLTKLIVFLKDTVRSSIFLFLIVSCALQYPCAIGKYLGKWHQHAFIIYSALVGHLALRFEKPQRRAALALFCTWRVCQQIIRRMLELKSYDSTDGTILESRRVPGVLFGGAIFLWLLCKDNPKVMKGIDKTALEAILG